MFDDVAVEVMHTHETTGAKREMLVSKYTYYEVGSEYDFYDGVYHFDVLDANCPFFCDGATCKHGERLQREQKEREESEQKEREESERQKEREERERQKEREERERQKERSKRRRLNQLLFQHSSTAQHRDVDGRMTLMLYGRQADGTSTAVHVQGLTAYGFYKGEFDFQKQRQLRKLVQWWTSMQRTERKIQQGNKNGDWPGPPAAGCGPVKWKSQKIFGYWSFLFEKSEVEEHEIQWQQASGFNIRNVRDGTPPNVARFQVRRYDIWRAVLSLLKDHEAAQKRLTTFYRKMANYMEAAGRRGMPSRPPNLGVRRSELYETMFKPELVWMVDHQLPACSWMAVMNTTPAAEPMTTCTVEYICSVDDVTPVDTPPIPMAPFRVLSYDIEALPYFNPMTKEYDFPEANRDAISTIGVSAFDMVSSRMVQTVFMLEYEGQPQCTRLTELPPDAKTDEYDPSLTTVHSFTDELDMLKAFAELVRTYDPEIITGFNILNFDNVYLIQRIRALCGCNPDAPCSQCEAARTFSRIARPSTLRKKYTFSKQRGGKESWEAWIEGRDWMDLYNVVMTDHKLRSYKLDNVCQELLGTKKMPIAYDDIPKHQKTPEGREFLAQYCVKDAWLPCQIIVKRCKLVNALQMSQVTGVLLRDILHRGQQIRTMVLMLQFMKRRCRRDVSHPRWFLPDESSNKPPADDSFEGAVVIRPLPGFYQTPVVTLDFASLYPSIMRAYNMCFSTLIPSFRRARQLQLAWSPETHLIKDPAHADYPEVRPVRSFDYPEGGRFEYKTSENDICFVTTKKRLGILPEILQQLLGERKRVKKLRKQFDEKSMDYAVLDGRQLALKVCANSVYGFTGASMGYLGDKRIASSVTRVGRGMANHTKFMCEEKYKDHGLQIVYGDTDSVFANIPASMCDTNCTREELIAKVDKIGDEMGKFCTKAFLPPNDLEYEKFYYPILLKGKKRYAGHKFEPGLQPKLDVKGFECVRRDFAPIVSKTQKEVLIRLIKQNNIQAAVDYAREKVVQLLQDKVPIEELTISKQLTRKPSDYKNPAPHVELAKRLQATLPAHIAPKTGDRIDYVIRPGYKGEKNCMRAVTPDDVRQGQASADTRWYLSNQLRQPLQRIFEMVMSNANSVFEVNAVQQKHAVANNMMRGFVQHRQRTSKRKRPSTTVQVQRPKKKKPPKDIAAFFR